MVQQTQRDPQEAFPGKDLGSRDFVATDETLSNYYEGLQVDEPRIDFPWLIDLYMDGRLKLDELITKYRPLDEINEAFEDMNQGVTARTILTFE